ncbi:flagellar hook-basal body complex protein FliE [Aurantimonas endophytica]|uniref:Flagellar hook-basal body complex protein FliE n=1 Tax=Aurantimonas endophytica TaxID=1522175 RepID=A0A7W6HH16_9HYPH|nr:flagellar hook-basal body complex protein FliE [Aurantimonas endophytica]MBB4005033.1 flagellar hook-basal body complex protein FliE [Aurantimonas endophytica]MCO6405839.1 flagellar hook-basal body protein FliE [Aurantimonas endophytica]
MISALGSAFPRIQTSPLQGASTAGAGAATTVGGADFGTVLSQVATNAMDAVKSAEATSIQGIRGEASTQAVVESVMAAERTLQTAVALRDKAVSAYLELSRMSI